MTRAIRSLLLLAFLGCFVPTVRAESIDTVRVGSLSLRDARLKPETYAIESFKRVDGVDTPTSTTRQTVRTGRQGDEAIYVIETQHAPLDGDTTYSSIVMRAADFSLLHHKVKATKDSTAATVNSGHLTAWVALPNEPVRLLDVQLDAPVFPIEGQMPWLFLLLPLREGYAAAIPHYSEWAGGLKWSSIRVVGSESIEFGGKTLDCWNIDAGELFPGYRATHWVDKATRRIIKSVARGADGKPEYWARSRTP